MGGINEATEVARGISEQGFLVMTAAFFLVLSAMMMVACFKWFKSIITKSMEDYGESLKELIEKQAYLNAQLEFGSDSNDDQIVDDNDDDEGESEEMEM